MVQARSVALALAGLLVCGTGCKLWDFGGLGGVGGGGGGGGCERTFAPSNKVVVHGTVRLAQDSTPHPWTQPSIAVVLCGPPGQVASGRADSLGRFSVQFLADCDATYQSALGSIHRQ